MRAFIFRTFMQNTKIEVSKPGMLFISLIIGAIFLVWYANTRATEGFHTCTELKAATGRSSIPLGDNLYNPAMDRNHDKIACNG